MGRNLETSVAQAWFPPLICIRITIVVFRMTGEGKLKHDGGDGALQREMI